MTEGQKFHKWTHKTRLLYFNSRLLVDKKAYQGCTRQPTWDMIEEGEVGSSVPRAAAYA